MLHQTWVDFSSIFIAYCMHHHDELWPWAIVHYSGTPWRTDGPSQWPFQVHTKWWSIRKKKNVFICTLCILTKWFSSIACFDTAQHVKAMSDEIKRLPHLQKSLRTVLLCKWCSFSPGNFWKSLSFYYSMKGILVVNIKNKFVGYLRNFLWEW